jgi:hypothetical protein
LDPEHSIKALDRSNEALATLQSSYDKEKKFCKGLTNRNFVLHKHVQDAKSSAQVLKQEKEKMKKTFDENVAAAEERYHAYRMKVKKDMISLRKAYELLVNGIAASCLPIDDAMSLSDNFFSLVRI